MKGAAFALGALLLGCLLSPDLSLGVKGAVDFLALGHSSAKTLALLAFFLALLLGHLSPLPTPSPQSGRYLSGALLLCAVTSLLEHLWYSRLAGLGLGEESLLARQGYWSINAPTHIHASKVLLSPLFGSLAAQTDAGFPFQPLFPTWLPWAHLALFLTTLVLTALTALRAYRTTTAGSATSLTLCLFVLAKNAVDGGPLSPEVWATLPVTFAALGRRRAAALLLTAVPIYLVLAGRTWQDALWRMPVTMLVLALPLMWEAVSGRPWRKVPLVLLGVLIYLSPLALRQWVTNFGWQPYALNLWLYGRLDLPSGYQVWALTSRPELASNLSGIRVEGQDKAGPFTLLRLRLLAPSTPLDLCRDLGIPISRRPVTWYPGEMDFQVWAKPLQGPLLLDRSNPLLRGLTMQPDGEFMRLDMRLAPGCNDTLAVALLGPQLTVLKGSRLGRHGEASGAGFVTD